MRLVYSPRLLSLRLVAAAIALAAGAIVVASGQACDKNATAQAARSSHASCPSMCSSHSASVSTASTNGACPHSATASIACPQTAPARSVAATRKHAVRSKAVRRVAGATASAPSSRAAGLVAVIDPVTGGVGRATPEQLRALAATPKTYGIATQAARRSEPEIVQLPDGTLICTPPDWLTMFAVAHRDAKGKIGFECQQEPGSAPPARTAPLLREVK